MKKLALISGLLFLVVYFWVNTFVKEDNSLDTVYPSNTAGTLTNHESPAPAIPSDIRTEPAMEVPAKELPAMEVPPEEVSAEELSAKDVPAEEMPAKELPAKEVPAIEVPAKELPAMEVPAKEVSAKENYLIVASFTDLEQANKMAEHYSDSHQAEMYVLPPTSKGFYRVSYGRYLTTREALAVLEIIRQSAFPDAWLLASK